jgi:glycosyltransferase involved in cell wall biosynthesis
MPKLTQYKYKQVNMICVCKSFGNLTGGTKSSSYLFSMLGSEVACTRSDKMFPGMKYYFGFLKILGVVAFKRNTQFFCFDHYALIPILFNRSVIFWSHSNYVSEDRNLSVKEKLLRFIFQIIYKRARRVVGCSKFIQSEIVRHRTECELVYPIFQVQDNYPQVKKDAMLSSKSRYLMVGNVDDRKYRFLLRDSIVSLKNITIIGSVVSAQIALSLKNKGADVLGFQPSIDYSKYDALLVASDLENVPAVIPEAISHGLPVVTRQVGGVQELLDDKKHGLILEDKLVDSLLNGAINLGFKFDNTDYKFGDKVKLREIAVDVMGKISKL